MTVSFARVQTTHTFFRKCKNLVYLNTPSCHLLRPHKSTLPSCRITCVLTGRIFFSPLERSISCSLFFSLHTTVCCSQACGRMHLKGKCLRGRDERSGEYSDFRQLKKEEKLMLSLDVILMHIRATQISKAILKHPWKKFQKAACHSAVFEWRFDAMILAVYLMH